MKIAARTRLRDALAGCQAIHSFVDGLGFADYARSLLVTSAVERQFEVVGEALRLAELADSRVANRVKHLRQIVELRNRLIHGYDVVDQAIIWSVIHDELPILVEEIMRVLDVGLTGKLLRP